MSSTDQHRRAEASDAFFASLAESSNDVIAAISGDGTIDYLSPASTRLLGRPPSELVGKPLAPYVHPDDLERALYHIGHAESGEALAGSAVYRLLHADGSWLPVDVSAGRTTDGVREWFVVHCRHAVDRQSSLDMVVRLLDHRPVADVLVPVLDSLAWQEFGSHVAITWAEDGDVRHVSTTFPEALRGTDTTREPWAEAWRTGRTVIHEDLTSLDGDTRALAEALGRGGCWVEPLETATGEPAFVTVWTAEGIHPRVHEFGVAKARRSAEVVLQFTAQRRQLDHAASHDPLTGLANRKALVEALDARRSGGSVLYCDLDEFKPVNDTLGHGAGDQLLGLVAERLTACVREGDLVTRLGGDEFVVLCRDLDREGTEALATRILAVLAEPFALGQTAVRIGASVGLAHADRLDESTLALADRALYAAKAAGRGGFAWADRSS